MTIEATIAVKKESILNPATNLEAIRRRTALMTKINRPSEMIVAGSVKKIRTGLRSTLSIAKTRATTRAVV